MSDSLWPHGLLPTRLVHGILQSILERVAIPSPGNLPNPGIEPRSPALQADSLLTEPPGKSFFRRGGDFQDWAPIFISALFTHAKMWKESFLKYKIHSFWVWIKDLNVRPETIKLLEENIGKTLSDIHHSRMLYDPPPRILEIKAKINKWDLIKLKSFCTMKETINRVKRQPS